MCLGLEEGSELCMPGRPGALDVDQAGLRFASFLPSAPLCHANTVSGTITVVMGS